MANCKEHCRFYEICPAIKAAGMFTENAEVCKCYDSKISSKLAKEEERRFSRNVLRSLRDFCLKNELAMDIWLHADRGANVADVTLQTDVLKSGNIIKAKITHTIFLDNLDSSRGDLVQPEIDDMLRQLNEAKERIKNE